MPRQLLHCIDEQLDVRLEVPHIFVASCIVVAPEGCIQPPIELGWLGVHVDDSDISEGQRFRHAGLQLQLLARPFRVWIRARWAGLVSKPLCLVPRTLQLLLARKRAAATRDKIVPEMTGD